MWMPKYRIANFQRYHPAAREITSSQRGGNGKLKWVRLDTDWDDDPDIAVLPFVEQGLWPWLLAKAGKGSPTGTVDITTHEIAMLTSVKESLVTHAMRHWLKRGRIVTERVTQP